MRTYLETSSPLLDKLETLKNQIPKGGWDAPIALDVPPLQSKRDLRIESMVETALGENRRFGSAHIKETVQEYQGVPQTTESISKRGRKENQRSTYKRVQQYWRAAGLNYTGLDSEKNWSKAFLSFVHQGAKLNDPFQNTNSVEQVIETAFDKYQPWGFGFEGHKYDNRKTKNSLKVGDLLVRQGTEGRELDLVTRVGQQGIEVVSGDYNDAVVSREIPLALDGSPKDHKRYPGFLRLK